MLIGKFLCDLVPRIVWLLLEAERHALFLAVDVEHEHFDFLAHLEHFARVVEAAPAHVGDVQQAVEAVEVDERAEIGDVLDRALDRAALFDAAEERLALLARSCSISSRRERTTFLRSSLSLTILHSRVLPS